MNYEDRVTKQYIENALANAGGAKIAYGSYSGTGSYGSGNKNSLSFSFQPKLVVISSGLASSGADTLLMLYGQTRAASCGSNGGGNYCSTSWSGNRVSWYATDSNNGAYYQMNVSGFQYYYVAIG